MRKPRLGLLRFRISPMSLKSAIGIVAIVALFGTSVQAADLPEAPSSAAIPNLAVVPPAVSTPNWTGPYIGLGFGLRYDAVDANVTSATVGTPPTAIALPPAKTGSGSFLDTAAPPNMGYIDNIALRGGLYGGWNYQITPNYVIGVEVISAGRTKPQFCTAAPIQLTFFLVLPAFLSELRPKTASGSPRIGTAA